MSCKDCGKPIDKYIAEQHGRLAARFRPGEPIRMPVRCSACLWAAIPKILEDDSSESPADEGTKR